MKRKCLFLNIISLMLISVFLVQTSLAWNTSSFSNVNNSIEATEFGLTLSYNTDNSDVFDTVEISSLLTISDTYYIKSEPTNTNLYFALKIIENNGTYQLGYIASTSEIEKTETVIPVSNSETQQTTITINENKIEYNTV